MSLVFILSVHTLIYNMSYDSYVTDKEDSLSRMVTPHQKKKSKLRHAGRVRREAGRKWEESEIEVLTFMTAYALNIVSILDKKPPVKIFLNVWCLIWHVFISRLTYIYIYIYKLVVGID